MCRLLLPLSPSLSLSLVLSVWWISAVWTWSSRRTHTLSRSVWWTSWQLGLPVSGRVKRLQRSVCMSALVWEGEVCECRMCVWVRMKRARRCCGWILTRCCCCCYNGTGGTLCVCVSLSVCVCVCVCVGMFVSCDCVCVCLWCVLYKFWSLYFMCVRWRIKLRTGLCVCAHVCVCVCVCTRNIDCGKGEVEIPVLSIFFPFTIVVVQLETNLNWKWIVKQEAVCHTDRLSERDTHRGQFLSLSAWIIRCWIEQSVFLRFSPWLHRVCVRVCLGV